MQSLPVTRPLRIGLVCPAVPGHLNPSMALAAELQRRGHVVSLLAVLDAEKTARAAGVGFIPLAEREYPLGSTAAELRELGRLSGLAAVRFTIRSLLQGNLTYLRELPQVCERERFDGLVIDQVAYGAASAAQAARIPYVTVANALWLSHDSDSPPCMVPWPHLAHPASRIRNRCAHLFLRLFCHPVFKPINRVRRTQGLAPLSYDHWGESSLATIAQQPPGFEFPEVNVPATVHFTGPFHQAGTRAPVPFPYERLDGRPLIYCSLGTIQNQMMTAFRTIAAACAGLDAQVVIALGVREAEVPKDWPGDPIVVGYAPQLELLPRAALVITHAGLNTALESLSHGLPMLAIPITNDQPGVAARLARLGAAEVVPLPRLQVDRLRNALGKVLGSTPHRNAALEMKRKIDTAQGLQTAGDIVSEVLRTNRPFLGDSR